MILPSRYKVRPFARPSLMQQMFLGVGAGTAPLAFDTATAFTTDNAVDANGDVSFSHSCSGSNRALIVVVFPFGSGTINGVTYNSVSMSSVGNFTDPVTGERIFFYKLSNPASGSNTVVIDTDKFQGSNLYAAAISFTGAHQTTGSLTGTFATNSGSTGHPTVNVSSASGEIVLDTTLCRNITSGLTSLTVDAGQTERYKFIKNANLFYAGSTEAGATTVTMSWTANITPESWSSVGVSIKPP